MYVRRIILMEKITLDEIWNIDVSAPARFSRGMTLKHIYMKFANFLWYTYNSVVPISWAKDTSKEKIVEKSISFPNKL